MNRRQAREIAVQSLYLIELSELSAELAIDTALEQMHSEEAYKYDMPDAQTRAFIVDLVQGTLQHVERIDKLLTEYLHGWKMDRLSRVDRQILRMALYEMFYIEDTPDKVVINEAVELAKSFGEEQSGKFVNGVLGNVLREKEKIQL